MIVWGIPLWTILLLIMSNIFMTIAWYGHLKFPHCPLILAIVLSWCIAFLEYCCQVPANRIGYGPLNPFQLKVIQECITLIVFSAFATLYFQEKLGWNHFVAACCLVGAVYFAFNQF